jgi:cell division protein FtsI/penicillin-binding protein 2
MRAAFDLQVVRAAKLKAQAEGQSRRKVALTPQRGAIYDRDGAELAVSVDADSIWANPRQLRKSGENVKEVAKRLASLLEIDEAPLLARLSSDRYFVWVKRRASAAESKAVQALKLPGLSNSKEARITRIGSTTNKLHSTKMRHRTCFCLRASTSFIAPSRRSVPAARHPS